MYASIQCSPVKLIFPKMSVDEKPWLLSTQLRGLYKTGKFSTSRTVFTFSQYETELLTMFTSPLMRSALTLVPPCFSELFLAPEKFKYLFSSNI